MKTLTFREYCKQENVNYNIGNEASRFYDEKLYRELIAKLKKISVAAFHSSEPWTEKDDNKRNELIKKIE